MHDVGELIEVGFDLASGNSATKVRLMPVAFALGFDVDAIAEITGFPVWRVRQVLSGGRSRSGD